MVYTIRTETVLPPPLAEISHITERRYYTSSPTLPAMIGSPQSKIPTVTRPKSNKFLGRELQAMTCFSLPAKKSNQECGLAAYTVVRIPSDYLHISVHKHYVKVERGPQLQCLSCLSPKATSSQHMGEGGGSWGKKTHPWKIVERKEGHDILPVHNPGISKGTDHLTGRLAQLHIDIISIYIYIHIHTNTTHTPIYIYIW